MLTFIIAYLVCGVVVGFFSGLFGIGGGVIGIPTLYFLFNMQGIPLNISMHMAIGTLFATVSITSLVSIFSHYRRGTIVLSLVKKMVAGIVLGSMLGIYISNHLHGIYLQRIFGMLLLAIALQMWLNPKTKAALALPTTKALFFTTTVLGTLSAMLGLGGGLLIVPYLNWYGIPPRNAVATSAVCILPAALVGSCGYMLSSSVSFPQASLHSGFIYWPAFFGISLTSLLFVPLGIKVAHIIPPATLKKFFAIFLWIIGITMVIK